MISVFVVWCCCIMVLRSKKKGMSIWVDSLWLFCCFWFELLLDDANVYPVRVSSSLENDDAISNECCYSGMKRDISNNGYLLMYTQCRWWHKNWEIAYSSKGSCIRSLYLTGNPHATPSSIFLLLFWAASVELDWSKWRKFYCKAFAISLLATDPCKIKSRVIEIQLIAHRCEENHECKSSGIDCMYGKRCNGIYSS